MSTAPTYPYELILFTPDRTDAAATRKKTLDGFAVQRKHEDFIEYTLEGVKAEDESIVMRILEWTSYDGHMRFRSSPLYAEFTKVREGINAGPVSMTHYSFFGPLPLKLSSLPPVFEVVDITLKSSTLHSSSFSAFRSEIGAALDLVAAYPSCLGYCVGWQKEDETKAMVFIAWESVEAHMEQFRKSGEGGWEPFVRKWAPMRAEWFEKGDMYHVRLCEPGTSV